MALVRNVVDKDNPGKVDPGNSSMIALPANTGGDDHIFIGKTVDITGIPLIFINVYSDVDSAMDGLCIQQSVDGENWSRHGDKYSIAAGVGKNYSIQRFAQYFRILYINGVEEQNIFELQTIFSINTKPSSHRIKDEIVGDDDSELVKAAITGENGAGDWHNVKVTEDGYFAISDNSSGLAIAQGIVTGKTSYHKFGEAPNFDTSDLYVTIWDGSDDDGINEMVYNYSTSAIIDSISSSNNGDTQDMEIEGLSADYVFLIQTITLTGQTRKALDTNLIRVFRMRNVGSADLAGDCYCYEDTELSVGIPILTNKIRAIARLEHNQTLMAVYTIPAGKTGYMRTWYAGISGAKKTSIHIIHLAAREFGGVFQTKHVSSIVAIGSSQIQHIYEEPKVFLEKTDVEIHVNTDEDAASISAGFDIVLEDN